MNTFVTLVCVAVCLGAASAQYSQGQTCKWQKNQCENNRNKSKAHCQMKFRKCMDEFVGSTTPFSTSTDYPTTTYYETTTYYPTTTYYAPTTTFYPTTEALEVQCKGYRCGRPVNTRQPVIVDPVPTRRVQVQPQCSGVRCLISGLVGGNSAAKTSGGFGGNVGGGGRPSILSGFNFGGFNGGKSGGSFLGKK